MRRLSVLAAAAACLAALALCRSLAAQEAPTNVIEELQARLDKGDAALRYDPDHQGYLKSLLDALKIPVNSQLLVFSKTSLQQDLISPKTPRALYFGDDIAVGSVPHGRVTEIIAADSKDGIAFYTLDERQTGKPRFVREEQDCLSCHGFVNRWAPGMVVANVTPTPTGEPIILHFDTLFDLTDSRTPFHRRWGGWYVTGTHGDMRHRGNVTVPDAGQPEAMPRTAGLNVTDLSGRFDMSSYLARSSDIPALMTLEHQSGFVNLVLQINAQYRSLAQGTAPGGARATQADIDKSLDELTAYMTFADEATITAPIKGISDFTTTFAAQGPRDAKGRSLRDFDLKTHLFRYPLSFMIYSKAFDSLNPRAKTEIWRRVKAALDGSDTRPQFATLAARDGRAAMQIVAATKKDAPASWKNAGD